MNIKAIIVGGYIRDYFLNSNSKDIDIELYGVQSFEELENILGEFGDVNNVGKSFGVCKLHIKDLEIDFSLPRIDSKVSSGHSGFSIEINNKLSFKEAASRRDFTINSIGYDTVEKKFLDPFDGMKDIKNKILKAVDINKFPQDPLRVLRLVVFASRFNFQIDEKLFLLSKKMCDRNILSELARERVFGELKKLLLKSNKPSVGFLVLKELHALKYFKPLDTLELAEFLTILKALDNFSTNQKQKDIKKNTLLMLAIICHKFNEVEEFILNLTNKKSLIQDIKSLIQNNFQTTYTDSELYLLATKVNIENFLLFSSAINPSIEKNIFTKIKNRAIQLNIINEKVKPYLQGRDILVCGIKPSQEYSKILKLAYEAQMKLEITSHKEAKTWLKKYLASYNSHFFI